MGRGRVDKMKKGLVGLMVLLVAVSAAQADIAVRWKSTSYMKDHNGTYLNGVTTIHQLIWSLSNPSSYVARYNTPNYLAPGEYLLNQGTTTDYGRFDYSGSAPVYDNSDVGGNNINSGYLYSRIIENNSPDPNTYYWQSVITGPGLTVYDEMNPDGTIITHITAPAPPTSSQCNIQMIPEPGTMGLVLAGLGMIALRRFRRK
jgi:hypothetical protein